MFLKNGVRKGYIMKEYKKNFIFLEPEISVLKLKGGKFV